MSAALTKARAAKKVRARERHREDRAAVRAFERWSKEHARAWMDVRRDPSPRNAERYQAVSRAIPSVPSDSQYARAKQAVRGVL